MNDDDEPLVEEDEAPTTLIEQTNSSIHTSINISINRSGCTCIIQNGVGYDHTN